MDAGWALVMRSITDEGAYAPIPGFVHFTPGFLQFVAIRWSAVSHLPNLHSSQHDAGIQIMTTLYKNIRVIAAVIVGSMVFSTGAAVALTKDSGQSAHHPRESVQMDNLGRMVVTPNSFKHVAPVETVGRFVVSQHHMEFHPAA
jgi:hypothetical protein